MNSSQFHNSDGSELRNQVLAQLLNQLQADKPIDVQAVVAEHPAYESEIRAFLAAEGSLAKLFRVAAIRPDSDRSGRRAHRFALLDGPRLYGDFELLEGIGGGGMGAVYKARQISLDRIVAVKFIRETYQDANGLARFQNEAQILAKLQHPHIVRILQVDRQHDRDFFAMEFIDGLNLREVADVGDVDFGDAARIMADVADGLHAAHERGVLHRDLKPSNILIENETFRPLILDFGLARFVAASPGLTATEETLGTPAYMAPEQLEPGPEKGTIAADVYSLGATLYHLLVRQPPFVGATPAQSIQLLAHSAPIRPRLLNPRIPRDLETICLKCLEKNPSRRYPSAAEAAADLRRFLNKEPIRARAIGPVGRAIRWSQRKPAQATVIALLAGLCFLAPFVALTQSRLRRQAEQERDRSNYVTNYMIDALRSPDPSRDGTSITVYELLRRMRSDLDTSLARDDKTRAQLMRALGETYRNLGLYAESVEILEAALPLHEKAFGRETERSLACRNSLAMALGDQGDSQRAIALLTDSLTLGRRLLGPRHIENANALNSLGAIRIAIGHFDQALSDLEQALTIRISRLGSSHRDTLITQNNIARVHGRKGHPEKAVPILEESLRLARESLGKGNSLTLSIMQSLAVQYIGVGRYKDASRLLEETCQAQTVALGDDHPSTMLTMFWQADLLERKGDFDKAIAMQELLLQKTRKKLGDGHPDSIEARQQLARRYEAKGDLSKALETYEEAVAEAKRHLGRDHFKTLATMNNMATCATKLDHARAVPIFEEVYASAKRTLGPDHMNTIGTANNLFLSYRETGQASKGLPLLESVYTLLVAKYGESIQPETYGTLANLALGYKDVGRFEEAIKITERLRAYFAAIEPPEQPHDPELWRATLNLGVIHREAGHSTTALPLLREALDLANEQHPPEHPNVLLCARELAAGLSAVGSHEEAKSLLNELLTLVKVKRGPDDPEVRKIEEALADLPTTRIDSAESAVSKAEPVSAGHH